VLLPGVSPPHIRLTDETKAMLLSAGREKDRSGPA
jgi:hypothetical protein